MNDSANVSDGNFSRQIVPYDGLSSEAAISCYGIIFVLALIGNTLVIMTLIQNKRMRTVTNVFLLNLAISDLLLAVFCMPFTIIPMLMRTFIFGPVLCYLARYFQGVSVGVSCFTLVAISMERYFAICRPLQSRKWQTLSHANRTIIMIWCVAFFVMIPIPIHTKHTHKRPGLYTCRELWPNVTLEKAYTIALDLMLLVIPLIVMCLAYGIVVRTLLTGIHATQRELNGIQQRQNSGSNQSLQMANFKNYSGHRSEDFNSRESTPQRKSEQRCMIRHSNPERSRAAKIKVIRMLFAVVIEYFICWTPLYLTQTWRSFHYESLDQHFSNLSLSLVYMLAFMSSACNPVTYCLLNKKFRQSFSSVCCNVLNIKGRSEQYNSLKFHHTRCSTFRTTNHDVDADKRHVIGERHPVATQL